jgi:hypothetical protein
MAEIGQFNAEDIPDLKPFEPLPAGAYKVQAVGSSVDPTTAGDGTLVKYEFEVLEGEHAGALLMLRFNYENQNPKAAEIGRSQLKRLCEACGQPFGLRNDTAELHGKPFWIKIDAKPGKGQYADRLSNNFKDAKPLANATPAAAQPRPTAPKPAATSTTPKPPAHRPAARPTGAPPWQRPSAAPAAAPAPQDPPF